MSAKSNTEQAVDNKAGRFSLTALTVHIDDSGIDLIDVIKKTYKLKTRSAAVWFALKTWEKAVERGLMPRFMGAIPEAYLIPERHPDYPRLVNLHGEWIAPMVHEES